MLTSYLTLGGYIFLKKIFFATTVLVYTVTPVFFLKFIFLLHLVRPKVKLIMYVDYMFHTVASWELICQCSCFESQET